MQLKYDDVTGAVYVYFAHAAVARTERVNEQALVDYDQTGSVVGVELLDAKEGIVLDSKLPHLAEMERLLADLNFRVYA